MRPTNEPDQLLPEIPVDCRLESYHFDLPEELIAQYPSPERGGSRLYVLDRANSRAADDLRSNFSRLPDLLPPRSLLVANNSRVIPARLQGKRASGGSFEFLLLTPPPLLLEQALPDPLMSATATDSSAARSADSPANGAESGGEKSGGWLAATAQALLRPAKKLKEGEIYQLTANLRFRIMQKGQFGQCRTKLFWRGDLLAEICASGSLPLPPYIRRPAEDLDRERYQTSFSRAELAGSVAAPTAGLHFTPELRQKLLQAGHDWAELTLFVGYGTFSPVREQDIRQHAMHPEYVEINAACVEKILQAKREGRPVIAVGTTSTRLLEGLAARLATRLPGQADNLANDLAGDSTNVLAGNVAAGPVPLLEPYRGWLNCFIYPGRPEGPLRVIDGLITNFHLPESTLLMLVSTLCGRTRLLEAYRKAVEDRFKFFSYGDAMLIR